MVLTATWRPLKPTPEIKIAIDHHATPQDVGRVFAQTRPKLAMLTLVSCCSAPSCTLIGQVMAEIAAEFDGTVLVAEDLMTIEIGKNISVIPYHRGAKPLQWNSNPYSKCYEK